MGVLELVKELYMKKKPQGYREDEIAVIKSYFNPLPKAVEDFWRRAGRTAALYYVQDKWVTPEDFQSWERLKNSDYLLLLNENQSVCCAGVRRADLTEEDPPVYVSMDEGQWTLCAGSVTEFLMAMLSYEAVFAFEYAPEELVYWLTPEEQKCVEANFEKKPYMVHGWMDMDITFYSNAPGNLVVFMDTGDEEVQAMYGAASEEAYNKLIEVMEGLGEP